MLPSLLTLALSITMASVSPGAENPVEVGTVKWGRDLEAGFNESRATGKPVFLLFQEVPGCQGCQNFGQSVLSNPLVVEAIEEEFVPVLVHNNQGGKDAEILKRFKEPAWNYQVVRFLDADGNDLIPRKDRVWTTSELAPRMVEALEAAQRPAPKYLQALDDTYQSPQHARTAFAMSCFWTGEMQLGRVEGVLTTEAGWLDGREVTLVVYDRLVIDLKTLAKTARAKRCADVIYTKHNSADTLSGFQTSELNADYRTARASDQKKQINSCPALREVPNLTDMQLTKINAWLPFDRDKALSWLSPRQQKALESALRRNPE